MPGNAAWDSTNLAGQRCKNLTRPRRRCPYSFWVCRLLDRLPVTMLVAIVAARSSEYWLEQDNMGRKVVGFNLVTGKSISPIYRNLCQILPTTSLYIYCI